MARINTPSSRSRDEPPDPHPWGSPAIFILKLAGVLDGVATLLMLTNSNAAWATGAKAAAVILRTITEAGKPS